MNEMIEKYAIALFKHNNFVNSNADDEYIKSEFHKMTLSSKNAYFNRIKIIIKAMREPTDEMIIAMEKAEPELECFLVKEQSPSYLVWQAAIDEILKT